MNYLEQIVAFSRWLDVYPLPASAIALWYTLMAACNKAGWPMEITVPNAVLEAKAGLSRKQFERARQMLITLGRITYKKSSRVNQAGVYTIIQIPIVRKGHQKEQQKGQQKGIRKEHRRDNGGGNGPPEDPVIAIGFYGTKRNLKDLTNNNNGPPISPDDLDPEQFIKDYETFTGRPFPSGDREGG